MQSVKTPLLLLVVALGASAACASAPSPPAPESPTAPAPPPPPPPAPPPAAPAPDAAPPAAPASAAPGPIPRGTSVLHIGDSFTDAGFAQALRPKLAELGATYTVKSEKGTYTTTWASRMPPLVAQFKPDLVIITLGANEIANTEPPTHAPFVRRIVDAIGGKPCVWVAPPLWRKDTGIIDVIREHSAPCRFFDSDAIIKEPIPRQKDKIHPSPQGGAMWAGAFWAWLHEQRAPQDPGSAAGPWALKPAPADEHKPRGSMFGVPR